MELTILGGTSAEPKETPLKGSRLRGKNRFDRRSLVFTRLFLVSRLEQSIDAPRCSCLRGAQVITQTCARPFAMPACDLLLLCPPLSAPRIVCVCVCICVCVCVCVYVCMRVCVLWIEIWIYRNTEIQAERKGWT